MSDDERALAEPSAAPPATPREQRRRAVRARSVNCNRYPKGKLALGALLYPEHPGVDYLRPQTRAECAGGPRPCPFVSCRHHLYLDVHPHHGSIKLNFPDLEVEDMTETCSLDVADRGGAGLEEAGALLNLTRERTRQLEVRALAKVYGTAPELLAHVDGEHTVRCAVRRLPLLPPPPDDEDELLDGDGDGEEG